MCWSHVSRLLPLFLLLCFWSSAFAQDGITNPVEGFVNFHLLFDNNSMGFAFGFDGFDICGFSEGFASDKRKFKRSSSEVEKLEARRSVQFELDRCSLLELHSWWWLSSRQRTVFLFSFTITASCPYLKTIIFLDELFVKFYFFFFVTWRQLLRMNLSGTLSPDLGRLTRLTIL